MAALKKKLESMVKLNKTLSAERATLLEKCKAAVGYFIIIYHNADISGMTITMMMDMMVITMITMRCLYVASPQET